MVAPIPGAVVTCDYDDDSGCAAGECGFHTGRDYRAREPTPVHATKAGRVRFAGDSTPGPGDDWGPAYGIQVIIETDGVRHLYAHLSQVSVAKDEMVEEGEQIGVSGATGNTGDPPQPHLHYEEREPPYDHCNDNREPKFDKEPETDDMRPDERAALLEVREKLAKVDKITNLVSEGTLPIESVLAWNYKRIHGIEAGIADILDSLTELAKPMSDEQRERLATAIAAKVAAFRAQTESDELEPG